MAIAFRKSLAWDQLNDRIVACRLCPRLVEHCLTMAATKRASFADWDYWGRPVPNLGDPEARLLIVGLAPAAHGANRTGRMFTGDRSGEWLFRALHKAGFANQPTAVHEADGLRLSGCAITAVAHCAPPDNKPLPEETASCRQWLDQTCDIVAAAAGGPRVFLALGQIAWRAVVDLARRRGWHAGAIPKFGHGALVGLANGRWLLGSYHPSQQNTFTGKLTEPMLDAVFATARRLLDEAAEHRGAVEDRPQQAGRPRRANRPQRRTRSK